MCKQSKEDLFFSVSIFQLKTVLRPSIYLHDREQNYNFKQITNQVEVTV